MFSRIPAKLENRPCRNTVQLHIKWDVLKDTPQAGVPSDDNVENDEGVFGLVWDAAGVLITRTEGDFEGRCNKSVCEDDDPISIAWAAGTFQESFPNRLQDATLLPVLAYLAFPS